MDFVVLLTLPLSSMLAQDRASEIGMGGKLLSELVGNFCPSLLRTEYSSGGRNQGFLINLVESREDRFIGIKRSPVNGAPRNSKARALKPARSFSPFSMVTSHALLQRPISRRSVDC